LSHGRAIANQTSLRAKEGLFRGHEKQTDRKQQVQGNARPKLDRALATDIQPGLEPDPAAAKALDHNPKHQQGAKQSEDREQFVSAISPGYRWGLTVGQLGR
jgi:hypothetical protein